MATVSANSKSPLEIGIDRVWRFFCSVRWAVAEITFLALLVLIGTLRGSDAPQWIADLIPGTQGIVDTWYGWDVYGSWIFAATLTVIAVAIAVCTLNRAPGIWQSIVNPTVSTTRGFLRNAETSFEVSGANREQVVQLVSEGLKQARYRVITREIGADTHIYADKNRWARMATFPFHLALILLLIGGIVAAQWGFQEREFVLSEGQTRSVGHGTDMEIMLEQFMDTYQQDGTAKSFESSLVVYEDGKEVARQVVSPNNPLKYKAATIYQSGVIYAVEITVKDVYGDVLYQGPVDVGVFHQTGNEDAPAGFINIPQAGLQILIVIPDTNAALNPELDTLQLLTGEIWVQVRSLTGKLPEQEAVLTQGVAQTLGDVEITFDRETRATVLQVANNPGVPIFIIASILIVGGLAAIFYFPQRRVRGMVSDADSRSVALLAPLARRDWSAKREFTMIGSRLSEEPDVQVRIKQPDSATNWE